MNALQSLVVDDSPSARVVLKKLLEKSGIQVHLSNSAPEAIHFLQNHSPDLIFMDHTMPGMDGLEATKAITTNPKTSSIPVVMYTSNNEAGYFESAKQHGAVDIVSKPASTEKLFSVLTNIFALHQDQQDMFNQRFNSRLDRFYKDIENLVEKKLAESELSLKKQVEVQLSNLTHDGIAEDRAKTRELLPLIHTVTDSKIHQLNIELRNHMTAKLDVMGQDLIEDNRYNNQQLIQEFKSQLPGSPTRLEYGNTPNYNQRLTSALSPNAMFNAVTSMLLSSNFYLGVLIASCAILIAK